MLRTIALHFIFAVSMYLAPLVRAADGPTTAPDILGGQREVRIDLVRADDYLLVPVHINGRDAGLFLLDTGAGGVTVTSDLAQQLGLTEIGTSTSVGHSGDSPVKVHPARTISLGLAAQSGTFVYSSTTFSVREGLGVANLNGILGNSFLQDACFRISIREGSLTLYDRASFRPPAGAKRFEIRMVNNIPQVRATVEDGSLSGWFDLDTGANNHLAFGREFVMLNRKFFEDRPYSPAPGAGPGLTNNEITISNFEVFGSRIVDVRSSYTLDQLKISESRAGQFGMKMLRPFDPTFDYKSGFVWVVHHEDMVPAEWRRADFDPRRPDAAGMTPLMRAISCNLTGYAKSFLDADVDINSKSRFDGFTALHYAAFCGNVEIVQALVSRGAKVDARTESQFTPLHFAAKYGPITVVQALLDAGAEPDARDMADTTALSVASATGRADVVAALLKAGADPNALSKEKGGPLHWAAWAGSTESIRYLLEAGADPNLSSGESKAQHPLMFAAFAGRVDATKLLLERGADLKATDAGGSTALIYAVGQAKTDVVRLLLKAGAPKNVTDKSGMTPLAYVMKLSDTKLISELLPMLYEPPATQPATSPSEP